MPFHRVGGGHIYFRVVGHKFFVVLANKPTAEATSLITIFVNLRDGQSLIFKGSPLLYNAMGEVADSAAARAADSPILATADLSGVLNPDQPNTFHIIYGTKKVALLPAAETEVIVRRSLEYTGDKVPADLAHVGFTCKKNRVTFEDIQVRGCEAARL